MKDGRILLLQRRRPPEAGCWGLPGGKVDWLEPVETAVKREIAEELGITLGALTLLCVVDQIDAEGGEHWVAPVYTAAGFTGEPRLMEPEKHSAVDWFDLSDPPEPLTVATKAALARLTA